ncbi:peroxiredoxin family protein [Paracandidimonas soli]|uniref:Peroxiredoxin n=1 Tax=Paracandidimonas soli TaxID=1917182 RepID=A0A4R3VBX8_9BURK|nr:TlpA disulfide reductase family protein [Paracandidimonas soli]TCV02807.1 peroxiredoxin [Paracandidimonas soli]
MKAKYIAGAVLAAALIGVGVWQISESAPSAPEVPFTTLTGEKFNTSDLKGKVVLVKFWATNCVTCIQQMPDTIKYQQTYGDRGFEVIGVAMQYDPPNYVKNFTETRSLPFKVVIDVNGEIAKAFDNVRLTPTAFLVDKQGNIIRRYVGNYDKTAFVATLEKALAG